MKADGLTIALLLLFFFIHTASAQQIDPPVEGAPSTVATNITWVRWFETQGQVYLRESIGDRPLPWDTPASRRWKDEAVKALLPLVNDKNEGVRAAAVLSLARLGHEPLLDRVLPAVGEAAPAEGGPLRIAMLLDPAASVRVSAWASLGLIDTPRSRAALAAPPLDGAEEADLAAQAMAIGLLNAPGRPHLAWLVARLDEPGPSLEVKRWCVWSLRQHDTPELDPVFDAVLLNLPSTFLISEVLLNPAYVQRRGGTNELVRVLRYDPQVRDWPGYRVLSSMPEGGAYGSTPRRLAMETRIAASLTMARLPIPTRADDQADVLAHLRQRMVAGNSAQVLDLNRGFDTLAYFMHCDASEADLDLLYDQLRGYAVLTPDDPLVVERVGEGEVPTPEDLRTRQPDNAVRGYAAIAAGLLIRRATEGTALFRDRPLIGRRPVEIERLKRRFGVRLMRAIADHDEPVSYRAARALALGLSGDDRYRAELAEELGGLRGGDEMVLGYGLMALAMLGDERVVEPARRYVTRPGKVGGNADRLGRCAALMALALIGDTGDDTRAALAGAWGRDPWVSLGAADASARAGVYTAVPGMIEATRSESSDWRLAAAMALGRVFDHRFPARLTLLIEASNPVMSFRAGDDLEPNPDGVPDPAPDALRPVGWPIKPVQALGDPFLYYVLRG